MKLYIFDLGGVLVYNNDVAPRIAGMFGRSRQELLQLLRGAFDDLCTGRATAAEFWKHANRALGGEVADDLWETLYEARVDSCVAELIAELKAAGSRVVAGTNTMESHYRYHTERGDLERFDAVYASHLMGCLKPAPAFYHHILNAEQVRAGDTVFIDDTEENVRAAEAMGVHGIRFTDCAALSQALRRHSDGETRLA